MTDDAPPSVDLRFGDCLAVLRELPDESVSAVVTDPPYGLADVRPERVVTALTAWANGDRDHVPDGKGFMGRAWDAFVPPPAVWDECLRVLKPGGHLLAFAGSRTADLMGLSVRMAGFEIRDTIMWVYGCLTADAEILTEHGWKNGLDVEVGESVAQWDAATGSISLAPVQETYRAPYDGPMRVLRNADTDQVLTPNHRVYHQPRQRQTTAGVRSAWYEPEWQVAEAAELSTWNPLRLPIAGIHDGPGIGGDDYAALLGWVWTEGGFDMQWNGVRVYQSSVNAEKVDEIAALMDRLGAHKRYDRERVYDPEKRVSHAPTGGTVPRPASSGTGRVYTETMWFISGELAERVRADLPGKRPTYDLLWRMTASEKRAMLQAALLGDGSRQGKGNWTFFQQYEDDLVWLQTLLALVGRAGKVGMRPNRPGGAVYLRDTATTELQARHLRDTWEDYTGEVWCVRVPTGAFVARRNGKVFITGNSGMPKGQNVGKAIDKQANAAPLWDAIRAHLREWRDRNGMSNADLNAAVGAAVNGSGMAYHWTAVDRGQHQIPSKDQWRKLKGVLNWPDCDLDEVYDAVKDGAQRPDRVVTSFQRATYGEGATVEHAGTPATPEAARWEGWNTSLKPAQEPIIVARKPLAGTVAATVLAHGTGAIHVDACRVETDVPRPARVASGRTGATYGAGLEGGTRAPDTTVGRWPANVVLVHDPACAAPECAGACPVAELDRQSGTLKSGAPGTMRKGRNDGACLGAESRAPGTPMVGYGDEGGASRFFPVFEHDRDENGCVEGCPVAELDRQSGTLKSGALDRSKISAQNGIYGAAPAERVGTYEPNEGGASRFFPVFEHDRDENGCVPGCPVAELDRQSGTLRTGAKKPGVTASRGRRAGLMGETVAGEVSAHDASEGGASRFFPAFRYQAKAPSKERPKIDGKGWPTVKPQGLMRWLVRLVTPPGGTILDPFCGTAATLQAARDEGFDSIGVERDEFAYLLACRRLGLPQLVPAAVVDTETGEPVSLVEVATEAVGEPEPEPVDPILSAIAAASSYDELLALWREHRWDKDSTYNEAATARRAELEEAA